jgi:hypothetical protein
MRHTVAAEESTKKPRRRAAHDDARSLDSAVTSSDNEDDEDENSKVDDVVDDVDDDDDSHVSERVGSDHEALHDQHPPAITTAPMDENDDDDDGDGMDGVRTSNTSQPTVAAALSVPALTAASATPTPTLAWTGAMRVSPRPHRASMGMASTRRVMSRALVPARADVGDLSPAVLQSVLMRLTPHELALAARVSRGWRTLAYDDAVWQSAWPLVVGRLRPTTGLRDAYLLQRRVATSQRAHAAHWAAAVSAFNALQFTDVRARVVAVVVRI